MRKSLLPLKHALLIVVHSLLLFGLISHVTAAGCRPSDTSVELLSTGIHVQTFKQKTKNGSDITRRYLVYLPKSINSSKATYPVVILNHGSWNNAEMMRETTMAAYEPLAERDRFIVVYSNALPNPTDVAPDECDNPARAHMGWWREPLANMGQGSDGFVDDKAYFEMIIADLISKNYPADANSVFMSGVSGGGNMAIFTAITDAEKYKAIAPVAAPSLYSANKEKPGMQLPISMFMIYSKGDPLYNVLADWKGYAEHVDDTLDDWASAMEVERSGTKPTKLLNSVNEGENYEGEHPAALMTRNSAVTVWNYPRGKSGKRLLVYEIDHGGHAGGHPVQWGMENIESQYMLGFRNQDFLEADVVWSFFKGEL